MGRGRLGEASLPAQALKVLISSSSLSAIACTSALGGRIGNRQAQRREGDEARTEVVEVVLDGLELAAHFSRRYEAVKGDRLRAGGRA